MCITDPGQRGIAQGGVASEGMNHFLRSDTRECGIILFTIISFINMSFICTFDEEENENTIQHSSNALNLFQNKN